MGRANGAMARAWRGSATAVPMWAGAGKKNGRCSPDPAKIVRLQEAVKSAAERKPDRRDISDVHGE